MDKSLTLKQCLFLFLFTLGTTVSFACINSVSIQSESFVDNGDGTCTYEVKILVDHTTDVATIRMDAVGGTFDDCGGSPCTSIPADASGTTTINAMITKNCVDEIDVFARGIGSSGFGCGAQGTRFSGADAGLPADLIAFEAAQDSRLNYLTWETASEENTMVFNVQRSLDREETFETIGRVTASGNSATLRLYEFIDKFPISKAYYRLQIVDLDGSYEYSKILVVERLKTTLTEVEVFPVPIVDNEATVLVHSKKEGAAFVDLFDMTGRVILQDRILLQKGVNRLELEWPGNEGNFYFLTVYNGTERISKKILKVNLD